ncbi:thiamine pyrophosphate-binding protein [Litoreibacter roseus]|uniref:Acetolactate synthase-1/2/3 large subunit n=1 Tax=Litoreibacter roseus TaxID=2601869 RepID=A0A6N6JKZ7_9RHOB|nr:thiamine pyrophosphate-binding protein [Litoreibacter roseus]GFE65948.1 hypothetical protein KIN_30220 [Litoreibacter roseus]
MPSPEMKPLGAQISHMLKDRGIDVIFGIPGVHNQELYRGIEEAGLTHVLARHEQGAGFMADGYARASGKPGVCYVITGPGLTNVMTPMGQAYSDSVPLLVLSSCLNRSDLGMARGRLHEMKDQRAAAETVADWSKIAMDAQTAYQLIDQALTEFDSARPRPKHIQIPIEVLEARSEAQGPRGRAAKLSGGTLDVSEISARLISARRPVFVFGGGCADGETSALAGPVLDAFGAACFLTYAGRGVVPSAHPLNFGSFLARPTSAEIFGGADLIIAVGTTLSETDLWRDDLGGTAPLVRIDVDTEVLTDHHTAGTTVYADAQAFFVRALG